MDYRKDLQGLRGLAVLSVILCHSGFPLVSGGFIGVDVFFVISGYLITGHLVQEFMKFETIDFAAFYARRLKRLLPALLSMIAGVALLSTAFLSPYEISKQLASLPYAITWISNIYFSFREINYFDDFQQYDLFIHTWSLGVEEQFYLFWPLFITALLMTSAKIHLTKFTSMTPLLVGFTAVIVISLTYSLSLTDQNRQITAFYSMPSRIWQFSIGALIFVITQGQKHKISKGFYYFLLSSGLLLILGSAIIINSKMLYPSLLASIPTLGAALTILVGSHNHIYRSPLNFKPLTYLGDRSYSLYLWHWPLLALGFSNGLLGSVPSIAMLLMATIVLAEVSYRLVEIPFWKGTWSSLTAQRILLSSFLVMSIAIFLTYYIQKFTTIPESANKLISQSRTDVPIIYEHNCDVEINSFEVKKCIFGSENAKNTVVIVGDSVGAQWFSFIKSAFVDESRKLVIYTKSACPIIDESYFYRKFGGVFTACSLWRDEVLTQISNSNPELVFVGSSSGYEFSTEQWITQSASMLEKLGQASRQVVVIPGTPIFSFDPVICLSNNIRPDNSINAEKCIDPEAAEHANGIAALLQKSTKNIHNVHLVSLNDLVCPRGKCSAITDSGTIIYRDKVHLTDSFVLSISKSAEKIVRSSLNN